MATEIIMPKAGMAMEEGTIVKWFKKEGDKIEKGEVILEILTDKVNMEIEAEESGTLIKILAGEGEVLPVLTPIGYIGEPGEKIDVTAPLASKANKETEKDTAERAVISAETQTKNYEVATDKVRATPAARKAARERGLALHSIKGTGPKGRVQLEDVLYHAENVSYKASPLAERIANAQGVDLANISGSGINGKIMKADVLQDTTKEEKTAIQGNVQPEEGRKIIPFSGMRKVIAERMSQSFFTAPTFTLHTDVDMTKVKALRAEVKDMILEETGEKVTFTDIIVMATAKALMKHSMVNASLVKEGIELHDYVHIGLAVGLDEGLLVPVIKNVHNKSLGEIVTASKDVIKRAGSKKLMPDELEGSTFTISNLGMFGVNHFNPIINQPNSAILGVNAITEKMVVIDGKAEIRPMMTLSLTIDHRVVDGAPGAKFLQHLKKLLENPMLLFI